MTRAITLTVNDTPVNLDYFVSGYLDHVTGGIIASLKNTGNIEMLELSLEETGDIKIMLNGTEVPLSYFPVEIIRSTVLGMVKPLKGVKGPVKKLHLSIHR